MLAALGKRSWTNCWVSSGRASLELGLVWFCDLEHWAIASATGPGADSPEGIAATVHGLDFGLLGAVLGVGLAAAAVLLLLSLAASKRLFFLASRFLASLSVTLLAVALVFSLLWTTTTRPCGGGFMALARGR